MNVRIVLLFALAVALTVAIFAGSGAFSRLPVDSRPAEGKLSPDLVQFESKFKEARTLWKTNEKDIYAFDKRSFPVLSQIDEQFKSLATASDKLKGATEAERIALPHLVEAVKASSLIPEIFMLRQVSPKAVTDEKLAEAKKNALKANEAWTAWEKATEGLSR